MAAELAGIVINDNLIKTENWQEQQAQVSRVAGALAGAIATRKAHGANSGAMASESVERYNRQLHHDELNAIKELAKGDKEKEARFLTASCRLIHCTTQESLNSQTRQHYETLMQKYPSTREEDGIIANYWITKERQRYGNYPAYAGTYLERLFTYTQADKLSDSEHFARNQWMENLSQMTGWSKESVETLGMTASIASTFSGIGKSKSGSQSLNHLQGKKKNPAELEFGGKRTAEQTGNALEWNSWKNYEKTTIDGKQYAQIGDRLYSQHAVDRMQPSSLGSPAGSIGAGRNISPSIVEHTIRNGTKTISTVNEVERTVHWSGDVEVVTENRDKVIVTILRRSEK